MSPLKSSPSDSTFDPVKRSDTGQGVKNLAICLGATLSGLAGYLRSASPHPTFFLGSRPALEGFCYFQGSYDTYVHEPIDLEDIMLAYTNTSILLKRVSELVGWLSNPAVDE